MKIQKTVAVLAILGGTGVLAFGQTGLGKHYDTRDPFVCKSKKEPAKRRALRQPGERPGLVH